MMANELCTLDLYKEMFPKVDDGHVRKNAAKSRGQMQMGRKMK